MFEQLFAPEPFDQVRHWFAVIDVARGEHKREQFALIVDGEMQFEAEIVANLDVIFGRFAPVGKFPFELPGW